MKGNMYLCQPSLLKADGGTIISSKGSLAPVDEVSTVHYGPGEVLVVSSLV